MKDNFEKRSGRLIVVEGVKWKWKVGKCNNVVAYSEFGEKKLSNVGDIIGRDNIEYARFTPYDVAQWINGKPVTKASPKSLAIESSKKLHNLFNPNDTFKEGSRKHKDADYILCDLLNRLGHKNVVDAYTKITNPYIII